MTATQKRGGGCGASGEPTATDRLQADLGQVLNAVGSDHNVVLKADAAKAAELVDGLHVEERRHLIVRRRYATERAGNVLSAVKHSR